MLHTLASGMKDWSVSDWKDFFAIVSTFVTVCLIPAVLTIWGKQKETAAKADNAQKQSTANAQSIVNLAQNMPAPGQPTAGNTTTLVPLLNVTPEKLKSMFDAANSEDSRPSQ